MSRAVTRLHLALGLALAGCGGTSADAIGGPDGGIAGPADAGGSWDAGTDIRGVSLRVWAPNATAASVTGDFPEGTVSLAPVGGGVFGATVAGARAGNDYRFVLDTPGGSLTRLDPYCRELGGDACLVVDPSRYLWKTSSFTRPAREQAVVYELHVGSFAAGRTFAAARARLADLADLGVNVIELMPVWDFGGNAGGWGYNPQLWLAPEPSYGTADDLRALVDEAHGLGIAVWNDVVMNHYDGWHRAPLYCYDGSCPQGSSGEFFFPAAQSTPWGPKPDYAQPEVTRMLLASVEAWLVEYRGDGLRWDSVSNIRGSDGVGTTPGGREFLLAANRLIHDRGGLSVAEDLKGWAEITRDDPASGFAFDAQWDGFGRDLTGVLSAGDDARDLGVVANALTGSYAGDPFARLIYLESHDSVGNGGGRLVDHIDAGDPTSLVARRLSMAGAVLLLTAPGVPMLFQGEESLATGGFGDPPAVLAAPTARGLQVRAFYRDMIQLRRTVAGLAAPGVAVYHRNDAAKVIAYQRGEAIVIVNLANRAYREYDVGADSAGPWTIRMNTASKVYGDDFEGGQSGAITARAETRDGKPYTLPVQLGAYAALVLTR